MGGLARVPDEREAVVRAGELHAAGLVVRQAQPGVRRDRRVEAPGGLQVADADPQVVDAAVGHGVLAVAMDRLDAVAVGVEQEGAVVRGAVLRARARRSVVAVPGVDTRLPERVDLRAVAGAEADVEPACQRVLAVRRADGPVVPLDERGVRMPGLDTKDAQDRAIEALGGREVRDGEADVVEHPAEATVDEPVEELGDACSAICFARPDAIAKPPAIALPLHAIRCPPRIRPIGAAGFEPGTSSSQKRVAVGGAGTRNRRWNRGIRRRRGSGLISADHGAALRGRGTAASQSARVQPLRSQSRRPAGPE